MQIFDVIHTMFQIGDILQVLRITNDVKFLIRAGYELCRLEAVDHPGISIVTPYVVPIHLIIFFKVSVEYPKIAKMNTTVIYSK